MIITIITEDDCFDVECGPWVRGIAQGFRIDEANGPEVTVGQRGWVMNTGDLSSIENCLIKEA